MSPIKGEVPPARWAFRLRECQQEAAQLVADRDREARRGKALAEVADAAWRLLDTGVAHGADATKAMVMLQDALIAYGIPPSIKEDGGNDQ